MLRKTFVLKILPLLYATLIIALSSMPNAHPPTFDIKNIDKFYHGLEYFIFGVLVFIGYPPVRNSRLNATFCILLFAFGLAYAGLDETVQSFVPNRDSSMGDWWADVIGYSLAGICMIALMLRKSHNKLSLEPESQGRSVVR
jgi:VanZ family protein